MSRTLSTQNTSPTPSQPGRWIIPRFGPPSVLKWDSWDPSAELFGDKVLVRILVAGIAGVDNIQRAGGYPHPKASKPGFTPGYDLVGEVISLGPSMIGTSSLSKFDYLRSLGVEPIDRNAPDLVEQVRRLTNGEGVDVAYDGVASKESLQRSLAASKQHIGKVVVFGVMGEIETDGSGMQQSVEEVLAERLQPPLISFYMLDVDFPKKAEVADFYNLVEKVRSGKLDPIVAKVLPLSDGVKANELLVDGSAIKGKMLFIVDGNLATQYGI
ncbi:hypothetical protein BKA66DRAFT_508366 [Pyrenochaeta sp. MPI-SDFR-AT-0127]|nr:hypothetical protein BKA66DRAFT_508366 [Pyrenochaeta sp. MPI-SDFR-AT-0127]